MNPRQIKKYCVLDEDSRRMLESAIEKRGLSSAVAPAADGVIAGFGIDSYLIGLDALIRLIERPED